MRGRDRQEISGVVMGRRGPAKKPNAVKRAEGNPGNNKINDAEPDYQKPVDLDIDYGQGDVLAAPEDLGDAGRTEWERICPMLIEYGVLRKADLTVFHKYCQVLDDCYLQERLLKAAEKALIFFDDEEVGRILSVQRTLNSVRVLLRHYAQELGLTPASRAGIKAKYPKGKSGANANAGQKTAENIPNAGTEAERAAAGVTDIRRFFKKNTA